jgi:hypothetical protein
VRLDAPLLSEAVAILLLRERQEPPSKTTHNVGIPYSSLYSSIEDRGDSPGSFRPGRIDVRPLTTDLFTRCGPAHYPPG